jgi:hypothetical protein
VRTSSTGASRSSPAVIRVPDSKSSPLDALLGLLGPLLGLAQRLGALLALGG